MTKKGTGNPSAEEVLSALNEESNIDPHKLTDLQLAKKLFFASMKAKKRKIDFNLSLAKYRRLLTAKRCFYTGVIFTPGDPNYSMSIDRVDNDQGYIDSNCVACCAWINKLKNNMSIRNILLISRGVNKHLAKSKVDTNKLLKPSAAQTAKMKQLRVA